MGGSAVATVGQANPFRYRGYYYDGETGYYYLNSRYYDPTTGRFLNPEPNVDIGGFDSGAGLLGYNVYAYCANNPVNFVDFTGEIIQFAYYIPQIIPQINNYLSVIAEHAAHYILMFVSVPTVSSASSAIETISRLDKWERSIAKLVIKAKKIIKNNKDKYDYWIANRVFVDKKHSTYVPSLPISFKNAVIYVRGGGNVFASSKYKAYILAKAVGYGQEPAAYERDEDGDTGSTMGYWYHYHAYKRKGGHIFCGPY